MDQIDKKEDYKQLYFSWRIGEGVIRGWTKTKEWRNLKIAGDEAARNDYASPPSGPVLVIHNFIFCPLPLEVHVITKFCIVYVATSLENLRCRGCLSNEVIWYNRNGNQTKTASCVTLAESSYLLKIGLNQTQSSDRYK